MPTIVKEYRAELNGLRALAVLLVLLYHLGFDWMKGGFLGVDVFLVISGYFISKNILYGLQKETFTFTGFYTKRLRRLFPALLFTLIVVLIAGYFLLAPFYYERLGISTLFASFSTSNFFFWSESGYFNVDASTKPLLHMWSLSLEEQFYLFWPLLLFVLYKFLKTHIFFIILFFVVGSLLLCEFYLPTQPEAVFFLIPFRMFEFLLGASCIWIERKFINNPNYLLEVMFAIGLILIFYSSIEFDNLSQMPGILSLIPCAGAMLIIIGGKAKTVSWTLKNKVAELIGKASYSIYLIHWPLIVYYKYWSFEEFTLKHQLLLGIISIFFGFLMWHFIENTFRYRKIKIKKIDPIWYVIPILVLGVSFASGMVWKSKGVPSRFSKELYISREEILANRKTYWKDSNSKNKILKGVEGEGHIIILGNSHAIDLIYALRLNGFKAKITSLQSGGKCYNFGTAEKEVDSTFCEMKKQANLKNPNWKIVDAVYLHDDWPKLDLIGFRNVVKEIRSLTDAPIYVFGPKMTYKEQVPEIVQRSKSVIPKLINQFAKKYSLADEKIQINNKLISEFKDNSFYTKNNIYYIDILRLQGGKNFDQFEIVSKDNLTFLYFDASHFTKQGAKALGRKMKKKYSFLFEPVKD